MKKTNVILLLLFIAATAVAQDNAYWTTQPASSARGRSTNTLGLSTDLSRNKRPTIFSTNPGSAPFSGSFSTGHRSSSSSYSHSSASASFSTPAFSFHRSGNTASAAHSTYTPNSGHSVNSLGLTAELTTSTKRAQSSGGSFASASSTGTKGSSSSPKYNAPAVTTRPVGTLAVTSDNDGGTGPVETFQQGGTFNDWTTSDFATPVGDAIIPMLVLLTLLIAYRKLRH